MESNTERGQVLVEMIIICLVIMGLFVFIFDRGQLTRGELAKSRFQSTSSSARKLQDMETYNANTWPGHVPRQFSQPDSMSGDVQ